MKKRKNLNVWLAVSIFLLSMVSAASGKISYVDANAPGANDGSSWTNAYNYLQSALADANSVAKPVEIRVAQGTYKPDQGVNQTPGNREASFELINGVTLKGGYAGFGEPDPNARDIELYETILSGDLDANDIDVNDPRDLLDHPSRAENSYHVVTGSGTDETPILDGFSITGGSANGDYLSPHVWGGGMFNDSGNPTLVNCTFSRNFALRGAGIYNFNSNSIMLTNCSITENMTLCYILPPGEDEGRGAGMYNQDSNLILINCTFSNNWAFYERAPSSGGGIYNVNSNVMLTNCLFSKNSASGGGGIYNNQSKLDLTNCTFTKNVEGYVGGGICNVADSNLTLTHCTFKNNSSGYDGGGVSNYESNPELTNCTFSHNVAQWHGGGVYNSGGSLTLANCTFSGNSTSIEGGGGMHDYDSKTNIRYCTFNGNSAFGRGGAIEFQDSLATITNCIISENSSGSYGGAIYCSPPPPCPPPPSGAPPPCPPPKVLIITNCTITGNTAYYVGGIYNGGESSLTNCIVWGNSDYEMAYCDEVTYSDIKGGWSGEGNIDEDPCFADPDSNDYHLKSQAGRWDANEGRWTKDDVTSPCIDKADPMSPIGPEPFPNGGIINMGAYGGTIEASKSYFGEPVCETIVAGDINGDCIVDFKDFVFIAAHWLEDR